MKFFFASLFLSVQVLSSIRTDGNPIDCRFSLTQPYHVLTVELHQEAKHSTSELYEEAQPPEVQTCVYECARGHLQRLSSAPLPLTSKPIICCRDPLERWVLLGLQDCSIVLFDPQTGPLTVGLLLHGACGTSMASFRSSADGGRRSRRAPVLWYGTLASPSAVSEWRSDSWVYRPQPAALSSHKNLWGARGDALGLLSDIPWKRGSGDTWLTAASVSWRAACCTEAKTRSVGPLCSLLDWNQIIWSVALKILEHDCIYIARRHKTNTQHSWRENLHLRLKPPFKSLGSVRLKKKKLYSARFQ